MTWAKLDDGFVDNLKIQPVGWAARGVWATGLAWCSRKLSDGRISAKAAAILEFPPEAVEELVAAGLWHVADDGNGWVVHDYLEYNPSKAEVVATRDAAKKRMGKVRDRRARSDSSPEQAHSSAPPDPDPVLFSPEDLERRLKPLSLKKPLPSSFDESPKLVLVPSHESAAKPGDYNSKDLATDFSRLRETVGGGKFEQKKSEYTLLQEAVAWAYRQQPADPRAACLRSITNYLASDWAIDTGTYPFAGWVKDPGSWYAAKPRPKKASRIFSPAVASQTYESDELGKMLSEPSGAVR
jgi:hypothetical protein